MTRLTDSQVTGLGLASWRERYPLAAGTPQRGRRLPIDSWSLLAPATRYCPLRVAGLYPGQHGQRRHSGLPGQLLRRPAGAQPAGPRNLADGPALEPVGGRVYSPTDLADSLTRQLPDPASLETGLKTVTRKFDAPGTILVDYQRRQALEYWSISEDI